MAIEILRLMLAQLHVDGQVFEVRRRLDRGLVTRDPLGLSLEDRHSAPRALGRRVADHLDNHSAVTHDEHAV
ncbi:hypothetical protein PHYSODRAFT_355343 [Phytophthora sojae]|uniref:Uncharacterized protein n=1 Tax=Phytophthora sojae (strain P6497) TaxID=1094619 RepID=G4ZZV1_PHYSP|nr:hypothetical protein PHYSODRAFT_355343 [Phytophthora sojae]EGZ11248.1 hypothetical protein PHYSODRAFT_355343 [Phytophthora sojae]|eukprot:XP_009533993.1 hypothetical protein PHYSODRAFT_355343 [Phytophthora sojae]